MVAVAEMFHFSIEDEFKRELKLLSRQIDHSRAQRKLAAELAAAKAAKANAATIDDNASVVSGSDVTSNAGVGFGQTLITKRGVQRQSSYLKDSTTSSNDTPQPTVNPVELKRQREEVTQRKKEEKEEKEKLRLENLKENPTEMGGDVQVCIILSFTLLSSTDAYKTQTISFMLRLALVVIGKVSFSSSEVRVCIFTQKLLLKAFEVMRQPYVTQPRIHNQFRVNFSLSCHVVVEGIREKKKKSENCFLLLINCVHILFVFFGKKLVILV